MEKWTNQTAFTTAAKGMLKQMLPSRDEATEGCLYRSEDKEGNILCCGVGFLVSDELAKIMDTQNVAFGLEGTGIVDWLSTEQEELNYIFSEVDASLLGGLQGIHDEVSIDLWEDDLKALAQRFNLKWEL